MLVTLETACVLECMSKISREHKGTCMFDTYKVHKFASAVCNMKYRKYGILTGLNEMIGLLQTDLHALSYTVVLLLDKEALSEARELKIMSVECFL